MIVWVQPDDAVRIWPVVEKLLAPAVATSRGKYETPDVLREILNGERVLWVALSEDQKSIDAAFSSRVIVYPRCKTVAVDFCGGSGLERWGLPFVEVIEKYARDKGAVAIEGAMRRGWARKYPGMKEVGVILYKDL